jgi:hypothetical protein
MPAPASAAQAMAMVLDGMPYLATADHAAMASQAQAECQVHRVRHKAHGGPTSLADCVLLCSYHHQVVIHRWGWTLVLNPDGTTTAWNPDRTKVLHSHSPPARAGQPGPPLPDQPRSAPASSPDYAGLVEVRRGRTRWPKPPGPSSPC